jgi:hypothetical protein
VVGLSVRDFRSNYERGIPPAQPSTPILLHAGLSMFDDEAAARARAVGPTFIAEVRLTEGVGVMVAKTLRDPHHFTVWGDPDALRGMARIVDSIPRAEV